MVVFVKYTRSPEAQYPLPLLEAYAATQYISAHAEYFGGTKDGVVVMGDSVGGNMATVVAMMAAQRGEFKVRQQILMYPVTTASFDTDSYRKYADGPWLTKKNMQWFWDNYLPEDDRSSSGSRRSEPSASPLLTPLSVLALMPPSLIITAENDVLRDEGEAYADRLSMAGVYVERIRCLGTIHDFGMLAPLALSPATRTLVTLVTAKLRSLA